MTECAPAAIALAISPEYLIPPSAMKGIPFFLNALATSLMAVICGTPTPATTLVVHIEPGPIPTFTPSAPWSTRACAASAVAIFPPIISVFGEYFLIHLNL